MSKGQHGNKEAKKPKRAQPPATLSPAAVMPRIDNHGDTRTDEATES